MLDKLTKVIQQGKDSFFTSCFHHVCVCQLLSLVQVFVTPWNSSGQNTGVGIRSLLQGILPTQGSNPGLPHCRRILYQLSHSPYMKLTQKQIIDQLWRLKLSSQEIVKNLCNLRIGKDFSDTFHKTLIILKLLKNYTSSNIKTCL